MAINEVPGGGKGDITKRTQTTNWTSCPALKIIIFNNKHFKNAKRI